MLPIRPLVLIGLGFVLAVVLVVEFKSRPPVVVEPQPQPVVAQPSEPELQADAEGYYLPDDRFTVKDFQFHGFSLHPDPMVVFAQTTDSVEHPAPCAEARASPDTLHLRCVYPELGTVTIDGRFLTRLATARSDTVVVSAVVTVTAAGQPLHSARYSFMWFLGE